MISKLKNSSDTEMLYPLLSSLTQDLLTLPVANAACERVFSSVHAIKTKQRNRFETEGVASVIFAKQGLNGKCTNFAPSKEMMARFDASIYRNVRTVFGDIDVE